MKKTSLVIVALLLLCLPFVAFAEGETETVQTGGAAVEAIRKAWTDSAGNVVYPDDYGGMYLDGSQQLVVCIVGLSTAREAELKALVPNAEIAFRAVKYSYAELERLCDEIALDARNGNAPLTVPDALGIGLDEERNVLRITVNVADEAAARAYYAGKYGDRIAVDTTEAAVFLPQTGSVTPPQTGSASSWPAAAGLILFGAACAVLVRRRKA